MSEYQVFARKYRPKKFQDVIGQEAIITTLIHAIQYHRLGHAYIFAGPHGTGKTSVARLFAKALNCRHLSSDCEPCDQCTSCQEIAGSYSLDVIEIDGASHRGIEDIRKINDTIGYAPPTGKYKIYLIDEVHMLTKEAFNALLKSLEEPPSHVKFFFATTEVHLIPQTIFSRCQRFNFKSIPSEKIVEKLIKIAKELSLEIEVEALVLLASLAEGGMRDAESLFDELVSFQRGIISVKSVQELFGLPEKELFYALDRAYIQSDFSKAFDIVDQIFSSGKNISYFLESLIQHYRTYLLKQESPYKQDSLLEILEMLASAQNEIKLSPSKKTFLELLLLRILKMSQKISLEHLVNRLEALEKRISTSVTKTESSFSSDFSQKPTHSSPSISHLQEKNRADTLLRFAAKELNGSIKRKEEI